MRVLLSLLLLFLSNFSFADSVSKVTGTYICNEIPLSDIKSKNISYSFGFNHAGNYLKFNLLQVPIDNEETSGVVKLYAADKQLISSFRTKFESDYQVKAILNEVSGTKDKSYGQYYFLHYNQNIVSYIRLELPSFNGESICFNIVTEKNT